MVRDQLHHIRAMALFADCNDDTLDVLTRGAFLQWFPPGIELAREGDPADFLHVVFDGAVEMFASHYRRETTIGFVMPGGLFILAAVLDRKVHLQSARTLCRSRVLLIPAECVHEAMACDAALTSRMITEIARGYRDVVRKLKDQKLRGGPERLASWILRTHAIQGRPGHIEIAFEKRVLASYLGMTPENLSRAFNTLKPYGISVQGPRIDILKDSDLETFAKPNPLIDDESM